MSITEEYNRYNGWANRHTWNVNLWAMNDEPIYRAVMAAKPFTAESAERFARETWPNGTPDMESVKDFDGVNWIEIARAWNED